MMSQLVGNMVCNLIANIGAMLLQLSGAAGNAGCAFYSVERL